ncbi:hypothetical protein HanPSC8_Chr04g0153731 [Helianthus annuus]|nr:hypothetical protein HanPSC8_Chr04g0153731 [Helianthus annuus]
MVQRIVAAFTIAKVNFICFCIVFLNFADCNRHRSFHLTRIPPSPLFGSPARCPGLKPIRHF